MKFLIIALALVASAYADVSELGYNYQQTGFSGPAAGSSSGPSQFKPERTYIPPAPPVHNPTPVNSYVPPPPPSQPISQENPINSYVPPPPPPPTSQVLPVSSYIPPANIEEPTNSYVPPTGDVSSPEQPIALVEEVEQTPEDGYHYKTVRRVVYRHRA